VARTDAGFAFCPGNPGTPPPPSPHDSLAPREPAEVGAVVGLNPPVLRLPAADAGDAGPRAGHARRVERPPRA
jgi:hypothetical protein